MCVTYLVGCPQSLGHSSVVHDPLVAVTFTVGSSLTDSLADHLSSLGVAFLVAILERPNLLEDGMSHEVCIFCANRL